MLMCCSFAVIAHPEKTVMLYHIIGLFTHAAHYLVARLRLIEGFVGGCLIGVWDVASQWVCRFACGKVK